MKTINTSQPKYYQKIVEGSSLKTSQILRGKLVKLVLGTALCAVLLPGFAASAQTAISIDFGTTGAGGGTDPNVVSTASTLGVVSVSNWNPIAGTTGVYSSLTDNSGTATTVSLSLTANNSVNNAYSDTSTPSGQMFRTYVDAGGLYAGPSTYAFSGLTFSLVDVYVYFDGANGANDRVGAYTFTSGATTLELFGRDAANATVGTGPFVDATSTTNSALTPAGNYVKFTGLAVTGNSFTLVANGDGYASDGVSRSPVNGIQIVSAVPEPSTYALLLGGLVMLVAVRRIQKRLV